jgi:hypothetical protein
LLTPVAGQLAVAGRILEVAAEATDDVRVDRVELTVDGVVVATDPFSPYRARLPVPPAASFTVAAVAYDNVGQSETSESVTVPIDPDAPPLVAILSPVDGDQVTDGAVVWVTVGATDDYGLVAVTVLVDGEPAASRSVPPFEIPVRATAGASSFTISATATDDLDQTTVTSEVELLVIADPLTTVEGRVVDAAAAGVAGAEVTCAGQGAVSGADGSFAVVGVPTGGGRIGCRAVAAIAGEVLTGATESVPPVLGGVTDVGALPVLPQVLYAGTDAFHGRLLVLDAAADRFLPWSGAIPPAGLSGLAFDLAGRLWATTLNLFTTDEIQTGEVRNVAAGAGFGGSGTSELLQLDPETGAVLAELGQVVNGLGSTVPVEDLAHDPLSGRLFGVDAEAFGETSVFSIDPATGVATLLADGFSLSSAGLALGADGLLYLVGIEDEELPQDLAGDQRPAGGAGVVVAAGFGFGSLALWAIDPVDGQVVWSAPIGGAVANDVGALVAEPGGSLLVASERSLYRIDLGSLELTEVGTPAGSFAGGLSALARRPLAAAPAVTDLVGLVLDQEDAPLAGVSVATIGAATLTDEAGSFALPDLVVRSGLVRVIAESLGERVFSQAVPPVAGGLTDLGILRLSAQVCAEGRLLYEDLFPGDLCASGPVTGPLVLEVFSEEEDEWLPAGVLTPELDGTFCADLREGATFRAFQDGVACACGPVGFCQGFLEPNDPSAFGRCEDPAPQCEDLGDVTLFCEAVCEP